MKSVISLFLILWLTGTSAAQSLSDYLHQPKAQVIAGHRGGFYDSLPENSIAAIDHTYRTCALPVMVEVDLRKSKEGTIFILHDETVDRTTNGHGRIAELTDEYLHTLLLKNARGAIVRAGMPTFDELLDYVKNKNVYLMLDIKADVWKEALEMVHGRGLADRCLVLTFTPRDTRRVSLLAPDVMVSSLVQNETDWDSLRTLTIPDQNRVAYISEATTSRLLTELQQRAITSMRDVSEHTRYGGTPLTSEQYQRILSDSSLGILITDFPTMVSKAANQSAKVREK